jgi:hypothetical protein
MSTDLPRPVVGWLLAFALANIIVACSTCSRGAAADPPPTAAPALESGEGAEPPPALGIGFLWMPQNEQAAGRLTSANDFVDLILGGGKMDVFEKVKPPVRVVCLTRSLERNEARPFPGLKETIEMLQAAGIKPQRAIVGYNPELQPGTPSEEMDQLVESVRRAQTMARAYGAPLLVGPGLRDMQSREHLYPELAKHCDIWLIQSQRLQMDPATRHVFTRAEYRTKVEEVVGSLRQGNPGIRVFVQVLASGRRDEELFTAEQVVAYARAIEDLVDAVRIYGGSGELVNEVITRLRGPGDTMTPAN